MGSLLVQIADNCVKWSDEKWWRQRSARMSVWSGIEVLYFQLALVANAVGSVSGMGSGVIIKPVLDFVGHDSVVAISFYSTVAVFTMSLV